MFEHHIFPGDKSRFKLLRIRFLWFFTRWHKLIIVIAVMFVIFGSFLRSHQKSLFLSAASKAAETHNLIKFVSNNFTTNGINNFTTNGSVEFIESAGNPNLFMSKDLAICGHKISFDYSETSGAASDVRRVSFAMGDESYSIPQGFYFISHLFRPNNTYKIAMRGLAGLSKEALRLGDGETNAVRTFVVKNASIDFIPTDLYYVFNALVVDSETALVAKCGSRIGLRVSVSKMNGEKIGDLNLRDVIVGKSKIWSVVESNIIGRTSGSKMKIFAHRSTIEHIRQESNVDLDRSQAVQNMSIDQINKQMLMLQDKDNYFVFDIHLVQTDSRDW